MTSKSRKQQATPPETDALLDFIHKSPSPYHAVANATTSLKANCQSQILNESTDWKLQWGKCYLLVRDGGSLLALKLPPKPPSKDRSLSFRIAAAHTDSPGFKLKPGAPRAVENYHQWGAEVYGGALLNSWLDRDLILAGRVSYMKGRQARHQLVNLDDARFRIPQLAIHLDREVNQKGLLLNPQKHCVPVMGLQGDSRSGGRFLIHALLDGAGIKVKTTDSLAFDLFFADAQPPAYGGVAKEFVYAPRLDNLAMTHATLSALERARIPEGVIAVAGLFNHEEVGSNSSSGAQSRFLTHVLERVMLGLGLERKDYLASLAESVLLSADMAHALHPNYKGRSEPDHFPLLGKGPVIKSNANLRYATSSPGNLYIQEICRRARVPFQNFVNRSDLGCGSTIGPFLASQLGMPVVDVGNPMLSMHSAREMAGTQDHPMMIKVLRTFFGSANI